MRSEFHDAYCIFDRVNVKLALGIRGDFRKLRRREGDADGSAGHGRGDWLAVGEAHGHVNALRAIGAGPVGIELSAHLSICISHASGNGKSQS